MTDTNNKKPSIATGQIIFGVTHHHVVVSMKISSITKAFDDCFNVNVIPTDDANKYSKTQVALGFNDLLLFDGEINKERVFTNKTDAKAYALNTLKYDEETLLSKLEGLRAQKVKLQNNDIEVT
jgi:homoserine trans-succinylase